MSPTTVEPAPTTYEAAMKLHDYLISRDKIVRMQTDGIAWWVEYADRFTGKWERIR